MTATLVDPLGGAVSTHRAADTLAGEVVRVATTTHTYEVLVQMVAPTARPDGEDDLADRRHVRLIGHVSVYEGGSACSAPVFIDREGSIVVRNSTLVFLVGAAR